MTSRGGTWRGQACPDGLDGMAPRSEDHCPKTKLVVFHFHDDSLECKSAYRLQETSRNHVVGKWQPPLASIAPVCVFFRCHVWKVIVIESPTWGECKDKVPENLAPVRYGRVHAGMMTLLGWECERSTRPAVAWRVDHS